MSVFNMMSPGTTGADDPPGITAFTDLPRTPPANPSRVSNDVPSGTSKLPGRFTSPATEKIFVPPLFGLPISRYFCGPIANRNGTAANVSVLLIVVGLPYTPKLAGNGGLKRGWPFLPSSDSSNAVSSPQIYAPYPWCACSSNEKPEPRIFAPR